MVTSVLEKKDLPIEEIVSIVGEASQAVQFNQALLHATIENIDQGISVVDREMRLVAWNQRYVELFDYPPGFIAVNRPIADVIRHNAERGECGPGDPEEHVAKRLRFMQDGNPHIFQRVRRDGMVLEIRGNPMPGGGFVTSFSDITEHKEIERKLIEVNDNLESRVQERTEELSIVNEELRDAIDSKMRFLAAVNHDMMQPLNAARLYTSALMQKYHDPENIPERISNSLQSAEDIIKTLLDISKLDSGGIKANVESFKIDDVLQTLTEEFSVIAAQRDIELTTVFSSAWVKSDSHLLRRILQNFLSNALRYANGGRVILGCRRCGNDTEAPLLRIEVWDNGIGIAAADMERIFEEFERLDNQPPDQEKGVGLGLAIAQRISKILGHEIHAHSVPGSGTVFSVSVPVTEAVEARVVQRTAPVQIVRPQGRSIDGMRVLCIDNDNNVLRAMLTVLEGWGCDVVAASSLQTALDKFQGDFVPPDAMLVDYHLDGGETGVNTMNALRESFSSPIPGVLITADMSETIKNEAASAGYRELRKPLNPGALRTLLFKYHQQRQLRSADSHIQN